MAEPKPFRPSPRQRRLAEAACSLTFNIHPHLVCAQAQIPPSTYYRWQKNPAFTAWLAATILQCLAANSPFLLLNTLQAAMSGDASARKLIFQFCIAPRLAPAMAALPAPGLEVFLGIPAVPGSEGPPPARPPSLVPRPSSPTSAGGMAVPAVRTHKAATTPGPTPARGEDATSIPGAPRRRRGKPAEGGANRNPVPPAAQRANGEPRRSDGPADARPRKAPASRPARRKSIVQTRKTRCQRRRQALQNPPQSENRRTRPKSNRSTRPAGAAGHSKPSPGGPGASVPAGPTSPPGPTGEKIRPPEGREGSARTGNWRLRPAQPAGGRARPAKALATGGPNATAETCRSERPSTTTRGVV